MKKLLNLTLLILLVFFNFSPPLAIAEVSTNNKNFILTDTANNEIFNVKININNAIKTVIVDDGYITENIVYDTIKNEMLLNGEKIPDEIVNSLKQFAEIEKEDTIINYSQSPLLQNHRPVPLSIDQGAGIGSTWVYEFTNYGQINVTGLTKAALIGALAAILTKNVIVGVLASIATAIFSSVSSERGSVYYKHIRYTKPHEQFPLLYKRYKEEVYFYKYSQYTGLIRHEIIYH